MNKEKEIVKILTPYYLAFPQTKIKAESLIVYAKALSPLSLEQIEAAMTKLLQSSIFFPAVAEIFREAENLTNFVNGTETKSIDEAWSEVLQQLHDAFVYKAPKFSTPEIEKAALSMGWTALCEVPVEGMNTARAQFIKIYESVLQRQKDRRVNGDVLKILSPGKVQALTGELGAKLSLVSGGK